eukprot:127095-Amphidinium_carterae.1
MQSQSRHSHPGNKETPPLSNNHAAKKPAARCRLFLKQQMQSTSNSEAPSFRDLRFRYQHKAALHGLQMWVYEHALHIPIHPESSTPCELLRASR